MTPERLEELKANCTNPHAMVFMNVEEILWLIAEVERLKKFEQFIVSTGRFTHGQIEFHINEACTCGGAGPGEGCPACEVWHALKPEDTP
jgi:hypothetical protein